LLTPPILKWDHLKRVQAKKGEIKKELMLKIWEKLAILRVTDTERITVNLIHVVLQLHIPGGAQHYDKINQILFEITGRPPLALTHMQEQMLFSLFQQIQAPFERIKKRFKRKNFPSYSFIIHKMCELLSFDEAKTYFPLLKSRDKLLQHQMMWYALCDELGWDKISSY